MNNEKYLNKMTSTLEKYLNKEIYNKKKYLNSTFFHIQTLSEHKKEMQLIIKKEKEVQNNLKILMQGLTPKDIENLPTVI